MIALDALPSTMRKKIATDGDCWAWTGALNNRGYGSVTNGKGGSMLAHRKSYEIAVGPIPTGLEIDHLCRNTRCINPNHLEPVTRAENARRRSMAQTRCHKGHSLSGANLRLHKRGLEMHRECRLCGMDATRRQYAAVKGAEVQSKARPTYDSLLAMYGAAA
jgi:HNH endonuclease